MQIVKNNQKDHFNTIYELQNPLTISQFSHEDAKDSVWVFTAISVITSNVSGLENKRNLHSYS